MSRPLPRRAPKAPATLVIAPKQAHGRLARHPNGCKPPNSLRMMEHPLSSAFSFGHLAI